MRFLLTSIALVTLLSESTASSEPVDSHASFNPLIDLAAVQKKYSRKTKKYTVCNKIVTSLTPAIRKLIKSYPNRRPIIANDSMADLISWTPKSCKIGVDRRRILSQAAKTLSIHENKAAVILPTAGSSSAYINDLIEGIKLGARDQGLPQDSKILFYNTPDNKNELNIDSAVAEAYLKEQVSLVVGGFRHANAEKLSEWSKALMLPTLLLNYDESLSQSKHTFVAFPNPSSIANSLADYAQRKGFTNVATLHPNNPEASKISIELGAALESRGIKASSVESYNSADYITMESAVKKLLQVAPGDRPGDWRLALREARVRARKAGLPFNPKMVIFPPKVDFDALFIPDNFKSIRHITKILQFLGSTELPLLGTFEWRSRSLVTPYNDYLTGAVFADFIGYYDQIPRSLFSKKMPNRDFISADDAIHVDFKIIGYRVGAIVAHVLKQKVIKRRHMHRALAGAKIKLEKSNEEISFSKSRIARWPVTLFQVSPEGLQLPNLTAVPTKNKLENSAKIEKAESQEIR